MIMVVLMFAAAAVGGSVCLGCIVASLMDCRSPRVRRPQSDQEEERRRTRRFLLGVKK